MRDEKAAAGRPADADEGGGSASTDRPTYVFLVSGRDAAAATARTLHSLLELPAKRTHIVVVDHDSTDDTVAVALTYPRHRVTVLQRTSPASRRDSASMLAAGIRMVRRIRPEDARQLIVGVIEAGTVVGPDVLTVLDRAFADANTTHVRLRVAVRHARMVGRMSEVTAVPRQPARRRGRDQAVTLDRTGCFTRLSAFEA